METPMKCQKINKLVFDVVPRSSKVRNIACPIEKAISKVTKKFSRVSTFDVIIGNMGYKLSNGLSDWIIRHDEGKRVNKISVVVDRTKRRVVLSGEVKL